MKNLDKLDVCFIFIGGIIAFGIASWLISIVFMTPLEFFYNKIGWVVFILPAALCVAVGVVVKIFKKKATI